MVTEPVVPRGVDDGDTDGDGVVVGRTDALEEALGVVDGVEGVEAVGGGEVGVGCFAQGSQTVETNALNRGTGGVRRRGVSSRRAGSRRGSGGRAGSRGTAELCAASVAWGRPTADPEVEGWHALLSPVDAEHFDEDAEFEEGHWLLGDNSDRSQHPPILAANCGTMS